jgi:hypothetical protein
MLELTLHLGKQGGLAKSPHVHVMTCMGVYIVCMLVYQAILSIGFITIGSRVNSPLLAPSTFKTTTCTIFAINFARDSK